MKKEHKTRFDNIPDNWADWLEDQWEREDDDEGAEDCIIDEQIDERLNEIF